MDVCKGFNILIFQILWVKADMPESNGTGTGSGTIYMGYNEYLSKNCLANTLLCI